MADTNVDGSLVSESQMSVVVAREEARRRRRRRTKHSRTAKAVVVAAAAPRATLADSDRPAAAAAGGAPAAAVCVAGSCVKSDVGVKYWPDQRDHVRRPRTNDGRGRVIDALDRTKPVEGEGEVSDRVVAELSIGGRGADVDPDGVSGCVCGVSRQTREVRRTTMSRSRSSV